MNLIPEPFEILTNEGHFSIGLDTAIATQPTEMIMRLTDELKTFVDSTIGMTLNRSLAQTDCIAFELTQTDFMYELTIEPDNIKVISGEAQGLFYGLQTLKQLILIHGRHIPCMHIKDKPVFENRGFYYDVTRGKVPKLDALKRLVDHMACFKLNQLQLYVEHTFLYSGQSEVWSITDPLTAEDILELDNYCASKHVELVPSIATFGHLYEALQTVTYGSYSEKGRLEGFSFHDRMRHHTLDVSLDDSFEFVKRMIDDFLPLVRSDKFNICADETFDLGEGKNSELAKKVGKSRLYVDFLLKIVNYVKSHSKEVMFWGDVILNHPECVGELPKDLICLNWWYDEHYPENKVKMIAQNGFSQYMCPGVNGWNTLMNHQRLAYKNIKMMTDYGRDYDALGILNTDWGDYGHWNFLHTSYPGMIYGAAFSWGDSKSFNEMNESINRLFYQTEQDIMENVVGISDAQLMTLLPLVRWVEKNDLEEMDKISASELDVYDANSRIDNCLEALMDVLPSLNEEMRKHVHAILVSGQGVKLMNQCYLAIKENVYGIALDVSIDRWSLAEALEYWLLSFKKIWLEDNKPSELYRIVDFMSRLTTWLRTPDDISERSL